MRSITDNGIVYPYQVFVPKGYVATQKFPVILFLHGSGERGSDGVKQTTVGLGPVVKAQSATFPAIVVFPQASLSETAHLYARTSIASLDAIMSEFLGSDATRVYLTGISYGGIYGYEVLYNNPTRFAAFVPISANICTGCITGVSGSSQLQAAQMVAQKAGTVPYWTFHGALDTRIPATDVDTIVTQFRIVNAAAKRTEYPNADHVGAWDLAYGTQALWDWLFAQHR